MADVGMHNLGPCKVYFTPDGGAETELETDGNVLFIDEVDERVLTKGSTGSTPDDGVFVGRQVRVEMQCINLTWAKMAVLMPSMTLDGGPDQAVVANCVGESFDDYFGVLVLKRVGHESDADYHYTVHKAVPVTKASLAFGTEQGDRQKLAVTFHGLLDASDELYTLGTV